MREYSLMFTILPPLIRLTYLQQSGKAPHDRKSKRGQSQFLRLVIVKDSNKDSISLWKSQDSDICDNSAWNWSDWSPFHHLARIDEAVGQIASHKLARHRRHTTPCPSAQF